MRLLSLFACLLLVSCASITRTVDKSGFATTDDGVQIHYRLMGPKDAPPPSLVRLWSPSLYGQSACRNAATRPVGRNYAAL